MERKPSGWTSPSSLLGLLGFASIVYSSYLAFQRDTGDRIARLEERMSGLEKQVVWLRDRQGRE